MNKVIDLRSDTVTKPTEEMLKAILTAEVGDDVYGEDKTVNRLQDMAKDIFKKEAALYVASGTMANQLAIKVHTKPGDEVILEEKAHPFHHEAGGAGLISGITFQPVKGEHGILDPDAVREKIRPYTRYYADTSLLMIENTHNYGGGTVYPINVLKKLYEVAKDHGLSVHIDGARIFNASIASGIPVSEFAKYCDTISFCLSKGLGAPIGSVLLGSKEHIRKAIKYRTMLGGGWRQAGVIAACGIYALSHNVERLKEDHANAKLFARGLSEIEEIELLVWPQTNIVIFRFKTKDLMEKTQKILDLWKEHGLLMGLIDDKYTIRAVFHLHITEKDTKNALKIIKNSIVI